MSARVSAIIPVYNGTQTIARALDSVLAQTFAPIEIVVVDDGSTDDLGVALMPYHGQIKLVRQPNRGLSAARNAGAAAAAGEYLAMLDADDLWMPERIARSVEILDTEPQCPAVFTTAVEVYPDGTVAGLPPHRASGLFRPSIVEILSYVPPLRPSTCTVRRSAFDKVGGYAEIIRHPGGEDIYFNLLVSELGPLGFVSEPLVHYRVHTTQVSPAKYERGRQQMLEMVRERYGAAAREAIRAVHQRCSRNWQTFAMQALARGDRAEARAALRAALRYEPASARIWSRMARTWLPLSLAQALSGRTVRRAG